MALARDVLQEENAPLGEAPDGTVTCGHFVLTTSRHENRAPGCGVRGRTVPLGRRADPESAVRRKELSAMKRLCRWHSKASDEFDFEISKVGCAARIRVEPYVFGFHVPVPRSGIPLPSVRHDILLLEGRGMVADR